MSTPSLIIGTFTATAAPGAARRVADVQHRLAAAALARAWTTTDLPAGHWCVRRLAVTVGADPHTPAARLATHWAQAVCAGLRQAADDGPARDVVHYRNDLAAAADAVHGLATGDDERRWAWRQLGLADATTTGADAVLAVLTRRPELLVGVLARVARAGGFVALHRRLGAPGWRRVAELTWTAAGGGTVPPVPAPGSYPRARPEPAGALAVAARRSRLAPGDPVLDWWAVLVAVEEDPALPRHPRAAALLAEVRRWLAEVLGQPVPGALALGMLGPGPDVPGPLTPGPLAPGPLAPGPLAPGPLVPGPDVPGPLAPGPLAAGPLAAGPDVPGPLGPDPLRPDPRACDQRASDESGRDRRGADRTSASQTLTDQTSPDRRLAGPRPTDQTGSGRQESGRSGSGLATSGERGTAHPGSGRPDHSLFGSGLPGDGSHGNGTHGNGAHEEHAAGNGAHGNGTLGEHAPGNGRPRPGPGHAAQAVGERSHRPAGDGTLRPTGRDEASDAAAAAPGRDGGPAASRAAHARGPAGREPAPGRAGAADRPPHEHGVGARPGAAAGGWGMAADPGGPGDPTAVELAPTDWAGLPFLLATAATAGLPDRLLTEPRLADRTVAWAVHQLGRLISTAAADDPGLLALAGLHGTRAATVLAAPPPEAPELAALARIAADWTDQTATRLAAAGGDQTATPPGASPTDQTTTRPGADSADRAGTPIDPDRAEEAATPLGAGGAVGSALIRSCLRRAGAVEAQSGWFEIHLPLGAADPVIRRAGLDLDPGWVPWLGAVVRYVYE